ncbi:MAG: DUF3800 domain-containing protein [Candidatus Paceibacterota bacterium]|jgi:hypothetical protein
MFKLFLDESGKNNLINMDKKRPFFSMGGIIIHDDGAPNFLKERANQIKFKYWNRTNVVFRGSSMRSLSDDFSIFRNHPKFTIDDFYVDFIDLLNKGNYKILWIGLNKDKFIKNNPPINAALQQIALGVTAWKKMISGKEKNLVKDFTYEVLSIYLAYLVKKDKKNNKTRGQVIMEAADQYQDVDILGAYNKLLFYGHQNLGLTNLQVRDYLTSVSFVTKKNLDIEAQLADLATHYLNRDEMRVDGICSISTGSAEDQIIRAFKGKLFFYKKDNKVTTSTVSSKTRLI